MKLFLIPFAIACLCIAASYSEETVSEEPFSEAMLETFKNLDPSVLDFLPINRAGDNSHWCCSNDQPVNTIQRTKVASDSTVQTTKVKVGYTNCGPLGLNRCTLYTTKYKKVLTYRIETYEVIDEKACADQHVKCCRGFVEIVGNCFTIQEAKELQAIFDLTLKGF